LIYRQRQRRLWSWTD